MATTDKILRNTSAELQTTFYVDGVATDADGDVTLIVTKPDATELFNGTADDATALDGQYEWNLTPQTDLTLLTLAWTGLFSTVSQTVTTYAEVIGQHLFSINEVRGFRQGKLSDDVKYPNDDVVDVREEITQFLEQYCRVSFIPRYRREVLDGNGKSVMYLDRREVTAIQTVTEDGVSLVVGTDIVFSNEGRLVRKNAVWSTLDPQNIVIEYEHGYVTPPGPITRAALVLLDSYLVGSDLSDRKVSQTDDAGTIRLSFPDALRDRPTGIPYVDARLNEYANMWGVV